MRSGTNAKRAGRIVFLCVGAIVASATGFLISGGCPAGPGSPVGPPTPSANSWKFVVFGDTRGDFDPTNTHSA
jgi:hypothetical protein